MTEFHPPYNFIPATGKVNGQPTLKKPYKDIRQGISDWPARHDIWLAGTCSGRIICRLHLDTLTVVGAEQIEEPGFLSKRVLPYQRDGQYAIPGNSLRGMVGSIAETLSQSALRVLESTPFKVSRPCGC